MSTTACETAPQKLILAGATKADVASLCEGLGTQKYRAGQILAWTYQRRAHSLEAMTDLPAALRTKLAERCEIRSSRVTEAARSRDHTEKLLVQLHDGHCVETVLIRERSRLTVCVSTQVGCAMGCVFCASGMDGLVRNLSAAEIVEQVLHAADRLGDDEAVSNIVVMGIGEPLANYDRLMKAIRIMNEPWGLGLGARRITVSTVGLPTQIEKLAREGLQINLAVSLHAPNDTVRRKVVPKGRRVGIERLTESARRYFQVTGRQITFEYVLLEGVNVFPSHAHELARHVKDLPCAINLIPYNPVEGLPWRAPESEAVARFRAILEGHGLIVNVRKKKGSGVDAACGQLRIRRLRTREGAR